MKERPTTDRAKEGLFNILEGRTAIPGISVLELFAGTGCIAYEFCSRGAGEVMAVEKDRKLSAFIERNAVEMGMEQLKVTAGDALRFLEGCTARYGLIFADPPYAGTDLYQGIIDRVRKGGILQRNGILVLEHDERMSFEGQEGFEGTRSFGNTRFSFFVFEGDGKLNFARKT